MRQLGITPLGLSLEIRKGELSLAQFILPLLMWIPVEFIFVSLGVLREQAMGVDSFSKVPSPICHWLLSILPFESVYCDYFPSCFFFWWAETSYTGLSPKYNEEKKY